MNYAITIWNDPEWSPRFIRSHKDRLSMTEDIKRTLQQDHAVTLFMKHEGLPHELCRLIATYVGKK